MPFDHRVPEKQSRFLTFFTTLPGVITAVATLITAVGGLLVAINEFGDNKPAGAAESPQSRPSASAPSPRFSPSPSSPPSPAVSTAPPVELNLDLSGAIVQKTMTVHLNDIVYLSDGSTGSEWANGDFKLDSSDATVFLRLYGGRPILDEFARVTDTVSKQSCATALKHPAGEFRAKSSDEGGWVCVLRPDAYNGTYGAIHFDWVDLANRRLTISYVIWR
ncbi:hypothetical protein HDA40_001497 [Hamadaea flava]|uniref:Uncharacterized protein n=1 Tax=Hamadaea flava TaxID=1742688 RepID=A0ABV8LNT0_9ACTN|nr:hypothetical protein [Hamadaea flava]MCP2322990.1 hypothetical protein [Hamadaea flava]